MFKSTMCVCHCAHVYSNPPSVHGITGTCDFRTVLSFHFNDTAKRTKSEQGWPPIKNMNCSCQPQTPSETFHLPPFYIHSPKITYSWQHWDPGSTGDPNEQRLQTFSSDSWALVWTPNRLAAPRPA